jgi:4'-phosphopantetheinyl transferase
LTALADPPLWERFELRPRSETAATFALAASDIHVWRINTHGGAHGEPEDPDRSAGPPLERAIQAKASARRVQLDILAAYAPGASLAHDPNGKPLVAGQDIHVSASYTLDVALFALAVRPLGIDVERQREIIGAEAIARSYFTPAEYARWRAERAPRLRFLEYWTRKEAYLKALGRGLAHPPKSVDPSYDIAAGVLVNVADGFESLRWAVASFHPSSAHTAAIVHVRAPDTSFRWLAAVAAERERPARAGGNARRYAPSGRQPPRA